MHIVLQEINDDTLSDVDKCNTAFVSNERLTLSAENGRINYVVVPMSPRDKKYPPELKDYREYLDRPDRVIFFAYVDEELAGQVRVLKWWNDYAYIDDIVVEPRFRGHGVGQALLERAVEWAREKHFPGVMLETQDINVLACRLYERCGFKLGGFDRYLYKGLHPDTDEIALYWYFIFPPSDT